MASITVTSANASGENQIGSGNQASWAAARGATTGNVGGSEGDKRVSSSAEANYWCDRFFFNFDTTSIPSTATILTATLKTYFYSGVGVNTNTISFHIVPSNPASKTSLAAEDFDNITFSSKGSIAYTSLASGAYTSISVTDLSIIAKNDISTFALITSLDLNNSTPTGRNERSIYRSGEANPPQLDITYKVNSGFMILF